MKKSKFSSHLTLLASSIVMMGTTSCASLFGNPNCHCTHKGPCVCCDQPQTAKVISHQAVTADSTVDKSFMRELLDMDYSIKHYGPEEPKRWVWVDDSITTSEAELLPYFNVSNGRFMPNDVTTDDTENGIYFYFNDHMDGSNPSPLRLRVQYYADDPLKFEQLHFVIDGFDYYFNPTNFKRGKGKGIMIWENSDDPLTAADKDLVYALTHCRWAQLKIIGADGMQHVKMITDSQQRDFQRTLQLYLLKGGTF